MFPLLGWRSSFDPPPGSDLDKFPIPIHLGRETPDDTKAAAAAPPRRKRASRPKAAAAPAAAGAEGAEEEPREGLWAPCGAGHARGVQAWDGESGRGQQQR